MTSIESMYRWFVRKVGFRVPALLLLIGVLFGFDMTTVSVVGFSLGFLFCHALASHVLRKVLFPYLDMSALFEKVKENAMACAITILAVCIVLSTLIHSGSVLWAGRG